MDDNQRRQLEETQRRPQPSLPGPSVRYVEVFPGQGAGPTLEEIAREARGTGSGTGSSIENQGARQRSGAASTRRKRK